MMPNSVLITGAKTGVGLAFVRYFGTCENGPKHIFAAGRKVSEAQDLVHLANQCPNVHLVELDISNDDQIQKAVKCVSGIVGDDGLNLLINNAAIFDSSEGVQFPNMDRDLINKHFDVNATSPLILTQVFLPLLKTAANKQPSQPMSISKSAVINIASEGGSLGLKLDFRANQFGMFAYMASKAGLNMLTKHMAVEMSVDGILMAGICPGFVDTNMSSRFVRHYRANGNHVDAEKNMCTPDQAVSQVMAVMGRLTDKHTGGFFRRNGAKVEHYEYASAENSE